MVAVLGHLNFATKLLLVASEKAPLEVDDLGAGVVEVVLAIDVVATSLQNIGQGAAYDSASGMGDVQRSYRIGADELDLDS